MGIVNLSSRGAAPEPEDNDPAYAYSMLTDPLATPAPYTSGDTDATSHTASLVRHWTQSRASGGRALGSATSAAEVVAALGGRGLAVCDCGRSAGAGAPSGAAGTPEVLVTRRTALVTGVSLQSGIGADTAVALALAGYVTVCTSYETLSVAGGEVATAAAAAAIDTAALDSASPSPSVSPRLRPVAGPEPVDPVAGAADGFGPVAAEMAPGSEAAPSPAPGDDQLPDHVRLQIPPRSVTHMRRLVAALAERTGTEAAGVLATVAAGAGVDAGRAAGFRFAGLGSASGAPCDCASLTHRHEAWLRYLTLLADPGAGDWLRAPAARCFELLPLNLGSLASVTACVGLFLTRVLSPLPLGPGLAAPGPTDPDGSQLPEHLSRRDPIVPVPRSAGGPAAMTAAPPRPLHVLVLNAGMMNIPYSTTVDGIERQMGVNHVGHTYLTHLLHRSLLAGAEELRSPVHSSSAADAGVAGPAGGHSAGLDTAAGDAPGAGAGAGAGATPRHDYARVVTLSSIAHRLAPLGIDVDTLAMRSHPWKYVRYIRYSESKLAQLLFAKEITNRYLADGIVGLAVHPGVVHSTGLGAFDPLSRMLYLFGWPFMKTPAQGAATSVFCSLAPVRGSLLAAQLATATSWHTGTPLQVRPLRPGGYFADCAQEEPSGAGRDPLAGRSLWRATNQLILEILEGLQRAEAEEQEEPADGGQHQAVKLEPGEEDEQADRPASPGAGGSGSRPTKPGAHPTRESLFSLFSVSRIFKMDLESLQLPFVESQ
ncbi:hypothetical protein H696_04147 [Fonticula alba]|uniref:Uncharacterized protein n=1 Tax=Fonticula alba TaxID=691883 RepID=A0A058Z733_FONAL|nr:hypothetical protein H696_04147 [Fonticula alba]KCV69743.1 hypothetical protein H696_04147 [Fonticula alba]|eukprot:XP_009496308.1 hypothetical protein H696_04147 [Fonticula alba]